MVREEMASKPPSIRDIAYEAHVSISAVSHAFNRPNELSSDVCQRILRVARERGYRPDPRARGLRRDESRLIALVITDLSNGFNATLAGAVQQAVTSHEYYLVVLTGGTPEDERHSLEAVYHERMAGAIVPAYSLTPAEVGQYARGRPVVFITDSHVTFDGPSVRVDNFAAAYAATAYLAKQGRCRIAHITGSLAVPPGSLRQAGYRQMMADAGLGPPLEAAGDFTFPGGWRAMEELLDAAKPPDAVFVGNDSMAIGALRVLLARGIAVPDDIAVIGFDNIEEASWSTPPLTTMDHSIDQIGTTAARLLLAKLHDPSFAEMTNVNCTLVQRQSA